MMFLVSGTPFKVMTKAWLFSQKCKSSRRWLFWRWLWRCPVSKDIELWAQLCSSMQLGLHCFDQCLLPTCLDQYAQYSNTCFDSSNYWCDDGHGNNLVGGDDDDKDDLVHCEDAAANGQSPCWCHIMLNIDDNIKDHSLVIESITWRSYVALLDPCPTHFFKLIMIFMNRIVADD